MPASSIQWPRTLRTAAALAGVLAVCAALYWAQAVLIPVALAGLLTFLLTPVVNRVERFGLPRAPAVVLVVASAATLLAGGGWLIGEQVAAFASDAPRYQENITEKLASARRFLRNGAIDKVQDTIQDVRKGLDDEEKANGQAEEDAELQPIPVTVKPAEGLFYGADGFASLARVLASAGLVIVLNVFMLLKREDLLDRTVSLVGRKSIAVTTKALHEAGQRISRYLLMQFAINVGFGTAVGLGLWLIGVPYSLLWGTCAALFRYVPYVGPWVAAALPVTVALIHFPTWTPLLLVVALFVVLELVTNNFLEPCLYGRSVGVSALAVILSAVFWAWIWGPVGLVMSTPITVCLVVLGKYVPSLSIFDRLLGDRPALAPHVWLYQRLLSHDEEDAEAIVEEFLADHSPGETCDELLMPLLTLAHRERTRGSISPDDEQSIVAALDELVDDYIVSQLSEQEGGDRPPPEEDDGRPLVIGISTTPTGQPALEMLGRLLDRHCRLEILSSEMLISQWLAAIDDRRPASVCVSSLAPGKLKRARLICKRLRQQHADLRIVVARWGAALNSSTREAFQSSGASEIGATLAEMQQILIPIAQFHAARDDPPPPAPRHSSEMVAVEER